MTRSQEREQAFILLFEKSFNSDIDSPRIAEMAYESEVIEKSEFSEELFFKACENLEETDAVIAKYAKGRSFARISRVSLAVLRLALTEIKYFDEVPVSVSINEAVELCKKYASEEEYSFVNGILGNAVRNESL